MRLRSRRNLGRRKCKADHPAEQWYVPRRPYNHRRSVAALHLLSCPLQVQFRKSSKETVSSPDRNQTYTPPWWPHWNQFLTRCEPSGNGSAAAIAAEISPAREGSSYKPGACAPHPESRQHPLRFEVHPDKFAQSIRRALENTTHTRVRSGSSQPRRSRHSDEEYRPSSTFRQCQRKESMPHPWKSRLGSRHRRSPAEIPRSNATQLSLCISGNL